MVLSNMPDLPAFRVVPPRRDVRVEDLTLPDGSPMVGPDGMLVPPARSFMAIVNSATRVYSYRNDEAMRDNLANARAMRRDAFLRGLFEERILPTINREWQLEVDDAEKPEQRMVRDGLTQIIKCVPDFDAFKRANLDGVWFGKAGCQWAYDRNRLLRGKWGIKRWDPLHGDSIQMTFDGVPAVLMDSTTTSWYASHGAQYGPPGTGDLVPTDRGGTALVLHRPYWRDRFSIHVHMREKADWYEGEMAGSVQGLGLRGLVYWQYVIRTDVLTWMLAYMQAVGQMDLLIFNYPTGNPEAKATQEANANKVIGKAAIVCPRNPQGNWPAVEQVQMNSAGLTALHNLATDYFDRHIERLFVGQSMSAGADKGTGLGGTGRAEFTRACVPVEGSEILTRDGFKSPRDVLVGEEVLAYDAETDTCKWTPLLKKSFYEDAELVRVHFGDDVFALCTPDHSWAVEDVDGSRRLCRACDIRHELVVLAAPAENTDVSELRGQWPADRVISGPVHRQEAGRADVWCPTTRYGTWVMRQNARVMITGNTKDEILVYDTGRLDSTFTNDLVAPLLKYNYPWADFPVRFKSVMPDVKAKEKVQSGKMMISAGVPIKLDEYREAAAFSRPKVGDEVIATPMPGGPPMLCVMGPNGPEPSGLPGMPQPGMPPGAPPMGPPGMAPPGMPLPPGGPPRPGAPMLPPGPGGAPVPNAAYGPVGGVNAPHSVPSAGPIRNDAAGGAGGYYPGGGNTYLPAWDRHRQLSLTRHGRQSAPTGYQTGPHEYCSTQVNLDGYAAILLGAMARAVRPEDLHDKGPELEPHVTVRWGLHGEVTSHKVADALKGLGPITLKLGKVSVFEGKDTGKDYDVLKVDVESGDLVRANRVLGGLPNTQTFPYRPHATIAYVKAGRGKKYADVLDPLDLTVTANTIVFSDQNDHRTVIDLCPGCPPTPPRGRGVK